MADLRCYLDGAASVAAAVQDQAGTLEAERQQASGLAGLDRPAGRQEDRVTEAACSLAAFGHPDTH